MTILIAKAVLLRPVKLDDLPLFLKWFNDPQITRWLSWRDETPLTEGFELRWIVELPSKKDWIVFVIEARVGKATIPIGICSLHDIDFKNQHAGLGVTIGEKEYQDKGYGTEAARLLIDYAFRKLNLNRLESIVLAYNNRSIRVLTKLGYKKEGCCRKCVLKNGKFEDVLIFGLLRHEYYTQKNK